MILTYKIKHNRDFSTELKKARAVANYVLEHNVKSTAEVKQFGLKSAISNQIIRKYSRIRNIKSIHNVNLIIPGLSIKNDAEHSTIYIPCLKLSLPYNFSGFSEINQIEITREYAHVSVTVPEAPEIQPNSWIGVDLNATGHCAVIGNPTTGKVVKLGKKAPHLQEKYRRVRRYLQKKRAHKAVKRIKNKAQRVIRDLNHKISRKIVDFAASTRSGIVFENLKGIRQNRKHAKTFNYSLHSWSFYQLRQFVNYKAKLLGIPVVEVAPYYTSQQCSRCGLLGNRNVKAFKCPSCGHVEHADANAAFNIALRQQGVFRSIVDRDAIEGHTGRPQEAPA